MAMVKVPSSVEKVALIFFQLREGRITVNRSLIFDMRKFKQHDKHD